MTGFNVALGVRVTKNPASVHKLVTNYHLWLLCCEGHFADMVWVQVSPLDWRVTANQYKVIKLMMEIAILMGGVFSKDSLNGLISIKWCK